MDSDNEFQQGIAGTLTEICQLAPTDQPVRLPALHLLIMQPVTSLLTQKILYNMSKFAAEFEDVLRSTYSSGSSRVDSEK